MLDPGREARSFASLADVAAKLRTAEHDGRGTIEFRRMFSDADFATAIDFVDVTVVHPGSIIGRHAHHGNEELYFIIDGEAYVNVCGSERRLGPGDVTVVRSGQWHELRNESSEDVVIGVVQVSAAK